MELCTGSQGFMEKKLSFDLEKEKFHGIPIPDASVHGLRVVRNCLCVFNHLFGPTGVSTICLMEEYGVKKSWTQVLRCSSNDYPEEKRDVFMEPVCILERGEVLVSDVIRASFLVLYDPEENTFKNVTRSFDQLSCGPFIYRDTLVSPVTGSVLDI